MLFKCKYVSNVPTVIAIANMSDNITDNASQVSVTDTNGISGSVGATTDMQTLVNTGSQKAMNNLASLVNDATAPTSYAVGNHILRNGQYSRVKQAIQQGASFTSSNLESACIGDEISNLNSDLASLITKKTYTLTLAADASAPLGNFKSLEVTSDVSAYGKIIGLSGYDASGYSVIAFEQLQSGKTYIAASGKSAGNVTIQVAFCKNTVVV